MQLNRYDSRPTLTPTAHKCLYNYLIKRGQLIVRGLLTQPS